MLLEYYSVFILIHLLFINNKCRHLPSINNYYQDRQIHFNIYKTYHCISIKYKYIIINMVDKYATK